MQVIQRPLNDVEWSMIRAFIRRTERSDLRARFGYPIDFEDEPALKRVFDVQAGGNLTWTPDTDGSVAGLLHCALVRPSAAEIALIVRSDLQRNGIGEAMARAVIARSARCGLKMLVAQIPWENKPTLELAKKLGFSLRNFLSIAAEFELAL